MIGVEEEFLLVDSESDRPAPHIEGIIGDAAALAGDQAQEELHRAQIELATEPCHTLGELRDNLLELRQKMVLAAEEHGCSVVASGTYPARMGKNGQLITRKDRYEDMERTAQILVREQLICGCHIHVSTGDAERAIRTMNRIRRWLPCLLALSANSPFWEGEDTGFSSYRTEVWWRWPTAGPPGEFLSRQEFDHLVSVLAESGVILDKAMAYWDIRPSSRFPTLEIRIADVMPTVENALAVAGLARGLVATCDALDDAIPSLRPELLRAANWMAARSGVMGTIMDPMDGYTRPAQQAFKDLFEFVGPALDAEGDLAQLEDSVGQLFRAGTGATIQRKAFSDAGDLGAVIRAVTLARDGTPGEVPGF